MNDYNYRFARMIEISVIGQGALNEDYSAEQEEREYIVFNDSIERYQESKN